MCHVVVDIYQIIMCSIEAHNIACKSYRLPKENDKTIQIELIHDQLPLAVPCYDLLPVTDFTLVLLAKAFGYPRLP